MILKKWEKIPEELKNDYTKNIYQKLQRKKISLIAKRLFDIIMSLILLIIFSPILIIFSIWIKLDSKGTVFYRQERITTYGRKFKIFKFRTMVQDADKIGSLVTTKEDKRITKVGEKIRKYRIDEIPQLINVLIGDMSFVGTRPEVEKYVKAYTDEMKATLLMPAGITSMASIEFKDEDEIIDKKVSEGKSIDEAYIEDVLPEKMKMNLEYIEKFSILEDIKICFKTVKKVFLRGEK